MSLLIDQYGRELRAVEKAAVPAMRPSDIVGDAGWWPLIREPFAGAWQRNLEVRADTVVSNVTVFRCVSLIASDIAKMRLKLITQVSPGVWEEADNPAWSPVIRKPNHFQNRIQFFENWMLSKLNAGNTYGLKQRDLRGVVTQIYILDPRRVHPLVGPGGDVFYQLYSDDLAGVGEQVTVPASEIIHDRWNCLFHPLCGLSPIFANGLSATQGLRIQEHSTRFFGNGARPGGMLMAPGKISGDTAERLKTDWQTKFGGPNVGMVAVLSEGLKYEPLQMTAVDAQLVEQQRWTGEMICSSYGVPAYKAGVAPAPTLNNIEALERQYYQACLQIHIESIELCVDEGLGLPANWGVEFDLDTLMRLDTGALVHALAEATGAGILKPDEGRARLGYGKVEGGDTPYLQQQNYSLAALNKRDTSDDPFGKSASPAAPPADTTGGGDAGTNQQQQNAIRNLILRAANRHDARLAA